MLIFIYLFWTIAYLSVFLQTSRICLVPCKLVLKKCKNPIKNKFLNKPGHLSVLTVLSQQEELAFASHIDNICEYGFPVDKIELKIILNPIWTDKDEQRAFKDNLLERDWVKEAS